MRKNSKMITILVSLILTIALIPGWTCLALTDPDGNAPCEALANPANFKYDPDKQILSWDKVTHADRYLLATYNEAGEKLKSKTVYNTMTGLSSLVEENTSCKIRFSIKAIGTGSYENSEEVFTDFYDVLWKQAEISNLVLGTNGILSWDPYPNAVRYRLDVNGGTMSGSAYTKQPSVDIFAYIAGFNASNPNITWVITVTACYPTQNDPVSLPTKLVLKFQYQEYDLYYLGRHIDSFTLNSSFYAFDPGTNTLRLSSDFSESMAKDTSELTSFITSGIDLILTGYCLEKESSIPFLESTGKLTIADEMILTYPAETYGIHASDIEIQSGKIDIPGNGEYGIWSDNDIVIKDGIETITLTSGEGGKAIFAENGKITLDNVMIAEPQGGVISPDGHTILDADGNAATKVVLKPVVIEPVIPDPGPSTPQPDPSTPEPGKDPSFEDFVERLYVVALGRPSEAEGKAFWVDQVVNKGFTGADCARFFMLGAPEFLGRNLTDDEFVEVLYKTYFDRDSEPDGKAYWLGRLASGTERAVLVEEFIESVEWCNVCATYGVKSGARYHKATIPSKNAVKFATRLYTCCLGRDPEEDGLNYWSLALTNLEATGYQAASLFFTLPEFVGLKTTDEEYLTRLYTTFMGREPEADGFNYWLGLLNGGTDRNDVMKAFASCPEFQQICNQYGIDRGQI
ncbi:MAG: DUF4214 domain-containing protein [Clostridiales bacterium]|nr:DUF4214 domain-containing protein [Clostridiales bacterium]